MGIRALEGGMDKCTQTRQGQLRRLWEAGYLLQVMTPKQALDGLHTDHIISRSTTPYFLYGFSYGVVDKDHPMIRIGAVKCLQQEESHHTAIAEDLSMSKV